jgi:hypothetical protein
MTGAITVHKLDSNGREVWVYPARLLARGTNWVRLEAHFDLGDAELPGLILRRGDRMVETYYSDKPYNVFAVFDGARGRLKGWYCNIARPAHLMAHEVSFEDLALDLLVYPDGTDRVLDEEEFAALDLPADERSTARRALDELRNLAARREGPFAEPPDDNAPA